MTGALTARLKKTTSAPRCVSARPLAVALALGVLLLPHVSAQAPTTELTVVLDPAGPTEIRNGGSESVTIKVFLKVDNMACTEQATVTIDLSAAHKPTAQPGIQAHFVPVVNVTIPQAFYSSTLPAGFPPANSTGSTTAHIMVDTTAPDGYNHTIEFQGALDVASFGEKCKGSGPIPAATASASYGITIPPKPKPTVTATNATGNATQAPADKKGSPGLEAVGAIVMLAALVVAVRRRGA